ncbi:MAG: LytTR family DNA-binding domain-containing protein [Bacteroidota bacterium]
MALKCVAIDDEPLALELIKNYTKRIPALSLVETFDDAISGIEYLNKYTVDLLFLDINMPDISGVDLARALINKPLIIFTTAYRQFAYEGFQLEAIEYLLKPFEFHHFSKAVEKALAYNKFLAHRTHEPQGAAIYVHSEYRLIKILTHEIEYIESMEDYIKIYAGFEKPVLTLMTMKKIMDVLPQPQFARIHRSYIINTDKIKSIQHKNVQLPSIQLPIGESYASQLKFN